MPDKFFNPYAFVPALPRKDKTGELGDRAPTGHDRFHEGCFSGRIDVTLTTVTPLLIPDAARRTEVPGAPGHFLYPLRVDGRGAPYLPPTSVKGMLRAAYEAVTNSRLSMFKGHGEKLNYRAGGIKEPYNHAPVEMLDKELQPATEWSKLSPADRVFGWVKDAVQSNDENEERGPSAHRGQIRISPITCESSNSVAYFLSEANPAGLPLAILGAPKPEQARFYAAADKFGSPLPQFSYPKSGYRDARKQGLRGRKIYPHHGGLPADHWDVPCVPGFMPTTPSESDESEPGSDEAKRWKTFLRQKPATNPVLRDNQNRSIEAWVKPGKQFAITIHVTNLSAVELGALLWLLDLEYWEPGERYVHRLGSGKPLGFGSVRLAVSSFMLMNVHDIRNRYAKLGPVNEAQAPSPAALVKDFRDACVATYCKSQRFEQVPFIGSFLEAMRGRSLFPTQYPTVHISTSNGIPGAPTAESYQWFVRNERDSHNRRSLPLLSDHSNGALPVYDVWTK